MTLNDGGPEGDYINDGEEVDSGVQVDGLNGHWREDVVRVDEDNSDGDKKVDEEDESELLDILESTMCARELPFGMRVVDENEIGRTYDEDNPGGYEGDDDVDDSGEIDPLDAELAFFLGEQQEGADCIDAEDDDADPDDLCTFFQDEVDDVFEG